MVSLVGGAVLLYGSGGYGIVSTYSNSTATYYVINRYPGLVTTCSYLFICPATRTNFTDTTTVTSLVKVPTTAYRPPSWDDLLAVLVVSKVASSGLLFVFHKLPRERRALRHLFSPQADGFLLGGMGVFFLLTFNPLWGIALGTTGLFLLVFERRLRRKQHHG